jgi:hypothetical protein
MNGWRRCSVASDIVERLRAASLNPDDMRRGWLAEAIDEIERLREKAERMQHHREDDLLGAYVMGFVDRHCRNAWNPQDLLRRVDEWRSGEVQRD